jgi:hypothetical protein
LNVAKESMEIRTYNAQDKEDLLNIFDSNCPKYFDPNDREYLADFLEKYADNNFKVITIENDVVGCGGYYTNHTAKVFGIAWVMFKRFALGRKTFSKLSTGFFEYLVSQINKEKYGYDIVINTTQLLEKTFNRFGFITEKKIPNGFGENLDHYIMRRRTT